MSTFTFKLYIAGQNWKSDLAIKNLRSICAEKLGDNYELVVIDVIERPELAEKARILATPTLVKEQPPPMRRIVGDLSNQEAVVKGLDLLDLHGDGEQKQNGRGN